MTAARIHTTGGSAGIPTGAPRPRICSRDATGPPHTAFAAACRGCSTGSRTANAVISTSATRGRRATRAVAPVRCPARCGQAARARARTVASPTR